MIYNMNRPGGKKLLILDFSHALNVFNINQYLRYSSFALAVQTKNASGCLSH